MSSKQSTATRGKSPTGKSRKTTPTATKPKRKTRSQRINKEAEQGIYRLLNNKLRGAGALETLLVELSSVTNISVYDPVIARVFYRRAREVAERAEGEERWRMFDALMGITDLLGITAKGSHHSDEVLEFVEHNARFPKRGERIDADDAKTQSVASQLDEEVDGIAALREHLCKLEYVPENEAARFKLEMDIFNLEHQSDVEDEWPSVIGGAA